MVDTQISCRSKTQTDKNARACNEKNSAKESGNSYTALLESDIWIQTARGSSHAIPTGSSAETTAQRIRGTTDVRLGDVSGGTAGHGVFRLHPDPGKPFLVPAVQDLQ
ncbi:hypothetical protein D3C80_1622250 [compost metagenome]